LSTDAELPPEVGVLLRGAGHQLLDGGEHLLRQPALHQLDVPVLLEDLAGDVQREVGRVDDALDEAQVRRQQRLAVIHDEDALDVELHTAAVVLGEQVVRGVGGQEEQGLVLEGALRLEADRLQRVAPVVADVLVQLVVLVVGHLLPRAGPQGLHRVQRLGLGRLAVLAGPGHQLDRPGDEVRVPLDDLADLPGGRVVVQRVLGVGRLQVQGHRGALRRVVDRLQGVRALTARGPAGALRLTGPPGHQGHLVGDHEPGVEADAELADEPLGPGVVLRLPQLLQELRRARVGDRADQLADLVVRHPDAVVPHGQGAGLLVGLDLDVQVGDIGVERVVTQRLQAQFVQRVGGVGDEFAQEDVFVRVHRVDHQLEQLTCFYLELKRGGRHGC
jgi:hypothetical protein